MDDPGTARRGPPIAVERLDATRASLNLAIDIAWTVVGLGPAVYYAWTSVGPTTLILLLLIGALAMLAPRSLFDRVPDRRFDAVRRRAARLVNRHVQDGTLVNHLLRQRRPRSESRRGDTTRPDLSRLRRRTFLYERFHGGLLVVVGLESMQAALHGRWLWVLVLCVTNFVYNFMPCLLQRDLRARIDGITNRRTP